MRVLCDICITFFELTPDSSVPSKSDGIGRTVSSEIMSDSCGVQDMLYVRAFLEAHEIERRFFIAAVNEIASAVAVSTPHTKEIPPKEVISQNSDLHRLANPLWAGGTSGRPTFCWPSSLTPKASTK